MSKRRHEIACMALGLVIVLVLSPAGAQEARWYKGNLHTHSLWSDGDDFPEMIADWYKSEGYDFLALSDHNVLSDHERWMPLREVRKRRTPADDLPATA